MQNNMDTRPDVTFEKKKKKEIKIGKHVILQGS